MSDNRIKSLTRLVVTASKFVFKILVSLVVPIIFFIPISLLLFSNIVRISGNVCCGLNEGDMVRWKEFDPTILQHGDIIFSKDPQNYLSSFSKVISFPGEYLFADHHTGKLGHIRLNTFLKTELNEEEISKLFSSITWIDSPVFQETIPSKNLNERLYLLSTDTTRYHTVINDEVFNINLPYLSSFSPEQIYGIYDSVFITADNVIFYYLTLVIIYLLLTIVAYNLLSRISKKKHIIRSIEE